MFNQESNADVCIIDRSLFLLRCFLPLPVEGGDEFRHGVWALVDEAFVRKYAALFDGDGRSEPAFAGTLSSHIPGYPDPFGLPVEVQLLGPSDRPMIRVTKPDHPLTLEQEGGISMSRVHELVRAALPSEFE